MNALLAVWLIAAASVLGGSLADDFFQKICKDSTGKVSSVAVQLTSIDNKNNLVNFNGLPKVYYDADCGEKKKVTKCVCQGKSATPGFFSSKSDYFNIYDDESMRTRTCYIKCLSNNTANLYCYQNDVKP